MRKTRSKNPVLLATIDRLLERSREEGSAIWRDVALRLSRPRRRRAEVNVAKIARYGKKGQYIIVPGKVLGYGSIDFSVNVIAFSFSSSARKKIEDAKGRCYTILEYLKNKIGEKPIIME